jgi:CheY-like chemotaxis protein
VQFGLAANSEYLLDAEPQIVHDRSVVSGSSSSVSREDWDDGQGLSGTRILVVDDQEDARELLAGMLECAGAEVTQADSVAHAMQIMGTEPFAVLVSDIGMPIEDGYDLIRRVRSAASAQLRKLPAVAVTAFCTQQDRRKAHSAGFQEHLSKPVDMQALVQTVARLAGVKDSTV